MNIDLTGKSFLVTGGSRGIGKALVYKLASYGANIAFTYNNSKEQADKLIDELKQGGKGKYACFQADVSKLKTAETLIDEVEKNIGPLYGLINNAGITKDVPFFKMTDENWEKVIETNLNGTFYMTKALVGRLIRRGSGKIVNMSSVSGMRGSVGQANYSSSKAGLIALTQTLAKEFARFNIQINALAPGFIATEMVESMQETAKSQINSMVPCKRMGTPEEVAEAAIFLLSESSNYINGHTLVIDGGLTA